MQSPGNVAWHFTTPPLEERAQKFYTDDVSLTRSGWCFWLVEPLHVPLGKLPSANQKRSPDLDSDTSSVWNFCVCFSDVILQGKQLWLCKMSAQVTDNEAPCSYYTLMPCPSNPRKNSRWASRLGVARITFSLQKKNYPMLSSPSSQFRLNSISAKSADTISEALAAISEKHNLTYMVLLLTDPALLTLLLKVAEWNRAWEQNFKNQATKKRILAWQFDPHLSARKTCWNVKIYTGSNHISAMRSETRTN